MRRHPRIRMLCAALSVCATVALPLAASAEVGIEPEGRSTRTRAKQIQSEFNGRIVHLDEQDRRSGRTLGPAGRGLSSEPKQRVSVGIVGCPGCSEALEALGGVVVDGRRWGRGRN